MVTGEHLDRDVRRCTAEDLAALAAREPSGAEYARGAFDRQTSGLTDFLVAVVDGVPLGSAELTRDDPPELKNLSVDAAAQGRGLGTALVRAAESLVEQRARTADVGERVLVIGVGVENPQAAALYGRLGFERTGVISSTTYSFIDESGATQAVTERDEELVRRW